MNRQDAYDEFEIGREPETLSDPALEAIIADLTRIRNSRRPRDRFHYVAVYGDAGLLREALVSDLSEWITAGFVRPNFARNWHAGVRRLEALVETRHSAVIDQLYADAALVLGAIDDEALVRVSELS